MDVRATLKEGMARLREARVASHTLAAELLLMHVLGRDRAWLYAHPEEAVDPGAAERYFELIARRASGVPTQYLTGRQEFWGLEFEVTSDVLIPRPETEHLMEVALARLGQRERNDLLRQGRSNLRAGARRAPVETSGGGARGEAGALMYRAGLRIADVGTGSGCLAVALARELPEAGVFATDISKAALEVARRNAARHGVASRVHFLRCNLLDALECASLLPLSQTGGKPPHSRGPCSLDLIVSNPPYVSRSEADLLPREVREHEPVEALFAGESGFEIYKSLIRQAEELMTAGGLLVLELGYNALETVRTLLDVPAWTNVTVTNDLAGIPRVAAAERA